MAAMLASVRSRSRVSDVAAETSSRKSRSSARSWKRTLALPVGTAMGKMSGLRAEAEFGASGFDDFEAGTGADAGGAGLDHFEEIVESADAAGGLNAHRGADGAAHESDVLRVGTRGAEAGGGFDIVGARIFRESAGADFLIVI